MAYLLDTNVFIQGKNQHYRMDFCPAFWDWLREENKKEKVFSIEKVSDELLAGDDELSAWVKELGERFFLAPDEKILDALQKVADWVKRQNYLPAAINNFLQDTDYYLVAHALSHNLVVVTHEIPSDGLKKIKIPNVCIGVKIKHMNPYEMLSKERARFVLGGHKGNI